MKDEHHGIGPAGATCVCGHDEADHQLVGERLDKHTGELTWLERCKGSIGGSCDCTCFDEWCGGTCKHCGAYAPARLDNECDPCWRKYRSRIGDPS